jgi:hypothetical protein
MALTLSAMAEAHGRSTSYITWTLNGVVATARVKMALIDQNAWMATWASATPPRDAASVLPEVVTISGEAGRCRIVPGSFHELISEHGTAAFEWQTRCAGDDGKPFVVTKLRSDLLFDVTAAHVALVRFHDPDAAIEADYVLMEGRRDADLPNNAVHVHSAVSTLLRFGRAGIEHLLSGWDHLAFLLALVLASRSLRMAIVCLTGFTLGHSVTLSIAVLGHAATKTATVEALIAASIVLVSMENVWVAEHRASLRLPMFCVGALFFLAVVGAFLGTISPVALVGMAIFEASYLGLLARASQPENLRWICAGLFGLLHGFGFAGMLGQMDMPPGSRVLPLASFNVGVELAQIAVVCVAWPLLSALMRRFSRAQVIGWGSALTLAMGTYGCVTRLWG